MWFRKMLVAAAALVIPATGFAWHNHLTKSVPAADATVTEAPKEIRLWFAEKVEPKFSSINLLTADSTKLEIRKAHATDDGHAVRGRYVFTLGK